MEKKLFLSDTNKKIGGVCGGLGEYFNIDPTLVRITFIVLILASGMGLLGYLLCWLIIPRRN